MTRSLVINTASHAVPIRREFRMAELTDVGREVFYTMKSLIQRGAD